MNLRYINSNIVRKRLFIILIFGVLFLIINNLQVKLENCFENFSFDDGKTLKDILDEPVIAQNTNSKKIFFHETSCNPGEFNED